MLEAAVDYARSPSAERRPFVMLELGAGFGFWTLTAHAALQRLREAFASRVEMPILTADEREHTMAIANSILFGASFTFSYFSCFGPKNAE